MKYALLQVYQKFDKLISKPFIVSTKLDFDYLGMLIR